MEVILSKQCLALTGILERGLGYYLQQRKDKRGKPHFYSIRQCGFFPPDGHWRFIVLCAELAQNKLHIADIKVSYIEFSDAVREAGMIHKIPAYFGWDEDMFMNATQVLNAKEEFGL